MDSELTQSVKTLQHEDQGHPSNYVGVDIKHFKDVSYEYTQQALNEAILDDIGLAFSSTIKCIPMSSSKYLHSHADSIPFLEASFDFNYHSEKLNCIAQTSRPDIIFAMHQLARYSADPQEEHGLVVEFLCLYLNYTRKFGIKFKADEKKSFELMLILHANSKRNLQKMTQIVQILLWLVHHLCLFTTEAEYISLSSALCNVIPIMKLFEEIKQHGFCVLCTLLYIYHEPFEDNSGALEYVWLPKVRSCPKQIAV
ncbi:hypothetical protein ACHAXS_013175 [Conticribra weissflogii]